MSRILLIDGTNAFIRNYTIVPTLTTHGQPNGGVYGTLNSLGFFYRITKPDRIIIAWDGVGGSKKRRKIAENYKKGRKPAKPKRNFDFELHNEEENKIWQRIRLGEYLNDLPITQITVDEVEADDIIGYLVRLFEEDRKIIASSDKDFFQLLDTKTVMFSPTKKKFINNKDILDEYKIHPNNFALARAIAGDASDNLPGVRGVGMKTVAKLFPFLTNSEKVDIKQLLEFCEKSDKKYKKFLENEEIVIRNLKVMRLDSVLIGNISIQKIHESLEKKVSLKGTSFRTKLLEDGISSIGEYYLQSFKVLESKGVQQ